MRRVERRQALHALWAPAGKPPSDGCAPVVPYHGKRFPPEVIRQTDDIGGQLIEVITWDALRFVAQIVAALVRRDDVKPASRKRRNLTAPAIPEFRESVKKKHERPLHRPRFGHMQMNSVAGDAPEAHDLGTLRHVRKQILRHELARCAWGKKTMRRREDGKNSTVWTPGLVWCG